jgi:hypothetical protein|tara:strand:+ start:641 stop:841 length:201 start_codon:yes stop_codon:yes gene_type:complete
MNLDDPNIEPENKILIIIYILFVVLPELLDEMPEICLDNREAAIKWLSVELIVGELKQTELKIINE